MMPAQTLGDAREAFGRQAWGAARAGYAALAAESALSLDDLDRYAVAAQLTGEQAESRDVLTRGFREALRLDDPIRAARFAFWLGHQMIFSGEDAQAKGWFGRARSLLSDRGVDCVEWGYLLVAKGIEQLIEAGDAASAAQTFADAQVIARRFAEIDADVMAGHGRGRALIRLGRTAEGVAVLDEVMVAVTSGEASPMIVGDVYCGVLEACHEVFDLRRAREWTVALSRWCEGQPDLVPYRGPCLVHRVELMRVRGDWEDALEEARRACDWLSLPASPEGPADAFYQLAELHRLRGEYADAEEAYRQASRLGRRPEPGCALLWLARGQADAADAAVTRALDEAEGDPANRAELLTAHVEILLARGDADRARAAASELAALAHELDAAALHALADRAEGSVHIAAADPHAALAPLRRSWSVWKELGAPYEAARTRVLIGRACALLGDGESAAMEFDAARWIFDRLGAAPDLAGLDAAATGSAPHERERLTPREIEVLSLIVAGETNKAIAAALVISEHTVARHVQNMLQKLGFSSRVNLAAFAAERGLRRSSSGSN